MITARCCFVVGVVLALAVGCNPLGAVGDSCEGAPCARGLVCDDGVCSEPGPPPPPPCVSIEDCALAGSSDGRTCVDGECGYATCFTDVACGSRICIDGSCTERILCLTDKGCDGGAVCVDNVCRPPCLADEDCGLSIAGFSLQVCVDGECLQRCLNDATCFGGGLCEGGICVAVECAVDDDCDGDTVACTDGRCAPYTPCAADVDCFDANFRCDLDLAPARCVERPTCFNDAVCGFDALCLANHCRPTSGCFVDDDCSGDNDECVGGRCVSAPACRAAADCSTAQTCVNLRCVAAVDVEADDFLVADDAGPCVGDDDDDDCVRTYVVGESSVFRVQGLLAGAPVLAVPAVASTDRDVVAASITDAAVIIDAVDVGTAVVAIGPHTAAVVVVEAAAADEVVVLVTNDLGTPVGGAAVEVVAVDRQTVARGQSDAAGVFRSNALADVSTIVVRSGGRGTAMVFAVDDDVVGAAWRLMLPRIAVVGAPVATATIAVTTSGDELGPVGLGLALPSLPSPSALSLTALLGDDVAASLTIPVIGTVPVAVPSALSVTATIPLLGEQVLRDRSEVVVAAGPAWALALEGRRQNDTLTSLALGGNLRAFALELFEQSETLDVELVALGTIAAAPLVADSSDRDGDGDTAESVADFAAGPSFAVRPSQAPTERSSVVVRSADSGVDEAVIVAGFDLPGRVVISGVGIARGLTNFEGLPLPESFKSSAAPMALSRAGRVVVVAGIFNDDDGLASRLIFKDARLPASADLGVLLAPPEGAFVVDDLPAAGDRSVLVSSNDSSVDLVWLRLVDGTDVIDLYAGPGGIVRLPRETAAARLQSTTILRTGGVSTLRATAGPRRLDDVAGALATAPAGR